MPCRSKRLSESISTINISIFENQHWEKILYSVIRARKKCIIYGFAHTTIRYWDLPYFRYPGVKSYPHLYPDKILHSSSINLPEDLSISPFFQLVEGTRISPSSDMTIYPSTNSVSKNLLILGSHCLHRSQQLLRITPLLKLSIPDICITYKPHPSCAVNSQYSDNFSTSNESIKLLSNVSDLVLTTEDTTACLDTLFLLKPTIVYAGSSSLTLSPLFPQHEHLHAYTKEELIEKIILAFKNPSSFLLSTDYLQQIYYTSSDSSRWKRFLNI